MGEGGDWKTARRFTVIARPPAGLHEWMSDANSHHAKVSFPHRSACCNFGIDTIMKYWRNVRYKLLCLQADKIFGIKRTRSLSPKPLHELTVAFRRQSVYIIYSLISFPLTDTILPLRSVTVRALARVVTRCVVAVRETVALVDLVKTFIYRDKIKSSE